MKTLIVLLFSVSAVCAEPTKPNIVIILTDDLGYGDLSCYGSATPTPNIDRLASEGTRFTDFHSNGAACSPTRCALMTGRYQQRAGIIGLARGDHGTSPNEFTIAEAMKSAGEQHDLSAQFPERVITMSQDFQAWAKDVGAGRGEGSTPRRARGNTARSDAERAVEE
jgi:hypothetical protein